MAVYEGCRAIGVPPKPAVGIGTVAGLAFGTYVLGPLYYIAYHSLADKYYEGLPNQAQKTIRRTVLGLSAGALLLAGNAICNSDKTEAKQPPTTQEKTLSLSAEGLADPRLISAAPFVS